MSWGDAPGWAALVVAIGALWVSLLARRDSRRSADADEAAVALQRAEAEERRQAALPKPEFRIERQGANAFLLRNVGTGPAPGVQILTDGLPRLTRHLPIPDGTTLVPEAAYSFVMAGSWGRGLPTHVMVTWFGLPEPVAVALPEYP